MLPSWNCWCQRSSSCKIRVKEEHECSHWECLLASVTAVFEVTTSLNKTSGILHLINICCCHTVCVCVGSGIFKEFCFSKGPGFGPQLQKKKKKKGILFLFV
ncbi:mitochondrial ribosomal protein L48 (predicted), isoform CRA_d [Rattus norvegicus]|uniref:Mitochondrial ribosomal protein L48 (Predicted), isoform CRA_d n=1 Tax=Rattus norvegicus TaxID=10116 RepID=A6I6P7_RAT|nr:mitochondrial ribosomal protein L48 (predicted), isoform CRA_d [Rattus norvegicus]